MRYQNTNTRQHKMTPYEVKMETIGIWAVNLILIAFLIAGAFAN